MQAERLSIPDVVLFRPKVFGDERGFSESFNAKAFSEATGLAPNFVQDNHSRSVRGVLRGLHYQVAPHAQGKLVRVVQGKCSMLRSIFAATQLRSVSGSAPAFLLTTGASYGFQKGSPMDS